MYKVVKINFGKLWSFNIQKIGPYKLNYEIDKWTYPVISDSKLFVFKEYEEAYRYLEGLHLESCDRFAIYDCSVINPMKLLKVCGSHCEATIGYYEFDLPTGTILCDAVMIHNVVGDAKHV